MDLSFLPAVNAGLNSTAIVLLTLGLLYIRAGRERAHRNAMVGAFGVSMLFLVLYVLHKVWKTSVGLELHTEFHGQGAAKVIYLLILFTHLVLAMIVPIFAVILLYLGFADRRRLHRRIARVAWPIWMYVSITGVVIYLMLYPFNPTPG